MCSLVGNAVVVQCVNCGVWCVVGSVRSVVCGCVQCGVLCVVYALWCVVVCSVVSCV